MITYGNVSKKYELLDLIKVYKPYSVALQETKLPKDVTLSVPN